MDINYYRITEKKQTRKIDSEYIQEWTQCYKDTTTI